MLLTLKNVDLSVESLNRLFLLSVDVCPLILLIGKLPINLSILVLNRSLESIDLLLHLIVALHVSVNIS